jgi:putative PEP-CTERM system TPR-repeat lipoprotein
MLATAILGAAGCSKAPTAQELVAEAKQYQQKGDTKSAIIQLRNALQKTPDNPEIRYLLGTIYDQAGDAKSAEKELRKALELRMDRAKALPVLAHSLLAQGEFQKVLDVTKTDVGSKTENSAEILAMRGNALLALDRIEDAKKSFEDALAKNPDHAEALLGQARLAVSTKNIDAAIELIDRANKSDPKNVDAMLMKGDVQRLIPNNEAAAAAYEKVIAVYPQNIPARLNLASIQIGMGSYAEARKNIEVVRKIAPRSPMANFMQALIDFRNSNYAPAQEAIQEVLKASPTHVPSVLLAGLIEQALGQYAQAEKHLAWVLEKSPENLYARRMLTAVLVKERQPQRAINVLQTGLKQAPGDTGLLVLAGEAYMQLNDFSNATRYFEKAASLDPKSAGARTGLGLSRLAGGESDRAMADLESAARLDPGRHQADILLVMSHIARNELDQALAVLQGLEKKLPNNPLTFNLKGSIYAAKRDFASARGYFDQALRTDPAYFPAAMNLAQLDLRDKNPATARKRLETILEKDSKNVEAMLALANLVGQTPGNEQQGVDWLERAKRADPGAVQPRLLLATYYLEKGDAKKAVATAQEALAISPDSDVLLDVLGRAQLAVGATAQALTTYSRLVSVAPQSPLALFRLASVQEMNNNQAGASHSLRQALELKPDYLEAQAALASLEVRAGHVEEARRIGQKAQKQAPKSPIGYTIEGDVLMAEKKFERAAKTYETAYGLKKSGTAAMKIHAAYAQAGKSQEGEAKLRQWLNDTPSDLSARFYLADFNLANGKYAGAIEQYRAILEKQPQNVVVLNNLAWAYHQAGDPRGLEYAERGFKLEPNNAALADTLGWFLVERGQTARGLELLRKATFLAPNEPQPRYHLAQAWLKSGDQDRARQELERLQADGAKFPQASEAMALLKQLKN